MPNSAATPPSSANLDSRPHLIVLSAPSGAGKTTLCRKLLEEFSTQLSLSISSTTRAPRGQEQHGREYYFMSRAEFEAKIREGEFAEWALVHNHYYGTSRSAIERAFAAGHSVLLDIDVQGAASLRAAYPGRCLTVFVAPPSLAVLEERLRARGTESEESVQRRLRSASREMLEQPQFDAVIVNAELERAYAELKRIAAPLLGGKVRAD